MELLKGGKIRKVRRKKGGGKARKEVGWRRGVTIGVIDKKKTRQLIEKSPEGEGGGGVGGGKLQKRTTYSIKALNSEG